MAHRVTSRLLVFLFFLSIAVPIVGLVVFTFTSGDTAWSAYQLLFADGQFHGAILSSFLMGLLSVALSILLLTPPLWYAYLYDPRALKVIEGFSFISFVLPAVVLGLGYVQFFSDGPLPLAGTPDLLPFAMTLLGMPFYTQAVLNRLRYMDAKTYHDAARSLGGSTVTSLVKVQLPLLKIGILNGSVLVFTISLGEFTITQLTTGGSYITLPIYMQSMFQASPTEASAMAVVGLVISAIAIFVALGALTRNRRVTS